jgi:hypothetical protein
VTRTAIAVAVVVLLGVFAAVAASVVHVRRPLDARVSTSFDRVMAGVQAKAEIRPDGCRKARIYFYRCDADMRVRRSLPVTVHWWLQMRDDGCWRAVVITPYPPPKVQAALNTRLRGLTGCATG